MGGLFRIVLIAVAWSGLGLTSYAQSAVHPADTTRRVMQKTTRPKPKPPKAIKHEASGGFRLNTDGWSVYADIGKVKPKSVRNGDMFYNVRLFQFELSEKKDMRQEKTLVDGGASSGSGSYFYGKINNFYALKLGYGFRTMLAGKPDPGSVSIHWVNVIGVSLGMLKPYYVNVLDDPSTIKYAEGQNDTTFLNQGKILGSAGFAQGLSEIKFIPGGHFKSALHFDFSSNRKSVLGAEVGFDVEYYSANVPLTAIKPSQPYFVDLFLAIQFGKRW
jgi:hypothetical protein